MAAKPDAPADDEACWVRTMVRTKFLKFFAGDQHRER
jgi:hypothetical protein